MLVLQNSPQEDIEKICCYNVAQTLVVTVCYILACLPQLLHGCISAHSSGTIPGLVGVAVAKVAAVDLCSISTCLTELLHCCLGEAGLAQNLRFA